MGTNDTNREMTMTTTEIKKLMPAKSVRNEFTGRWVWTKRGGYCDAAMKALRARLETAGFAPATRDLTGSPDGSHVGSGTEHRNAAGDAVVVHRSYGVTAYDNHYRVEFVPAAAVTA